MEEADKYTPRVKSGASMEFVSIFTCLMMCLLTYNVSSRYYLDIL